MSTRCSQTTLERGLNHVLSFDPNVDTHLRELCGKSVEIYVSGSELGVIVIFQADGVRLVSRDAGIAADARLHGSFSAFIKMANDIRLGNSVFGSAVNVSGDVEVVQQLKSFLGELDIDWEEQLSRWFGDAGAHGLGLVLRSLHNWGRQTAQAFWLDFGEYLVEETWVSPDPEEVVAYLEGVDEIRDDVERLSARIARLT